MAHQENTNGNRLPSRANLVQFRRASRKLEHLNIDDLLSNILTIDPDETLRNILDEEIEVIIKNSDKAEYIEKAVRYKRNRIKKKIITKNKKKKSLKRKELVHLM